MVNSIEEVTEIVRGGLEEAEQQNREVEVVSEVIALLSVGSGMSVREAWIVALKGE
jgi:hypothetical protein